jgi:hypothetical protein
VSRAAPWLAALALGLPAGAAASAWGLGGALGMGYDANAANAGDPDDIRGVSAVFASAGANWERRFGLFTALQLQGALTGESVFDLERLSNAGLGARVRLLHKPGKGLYTPVLAAWISAAAREYDSPIRDGSEYRAGAWAAVPLTTTVQLRAEAQWSQAEANSRVFDLGYASYALNADWLAGQALTVYANVRFNEGEYAVSADEGRQYVEDIATAEVPDPAFGDGWWAYRVDGHMWITTLGFNVPLSGDVALDVQARHSDAQASGFSYDRWLGSVGLLFRW